MLDRKEQGMGMEMEGNWNRQDNSLDAAAAIAPKKGAEVEEEESKKNTPLQCVC